MFIDKNLISHVEDEHLIFKATDLYRFYVDREDIGDN